jgi:hypothetical protein
MINHQRDTDISTSVQSYTKDIMDETQMKYQEVNKDT